MYSDPLQKLCGITYPKPTQNSWHSGVIDSDKASEISAQLSNIEQHHNVRILYSCLVGSRAHGVYQPDSAHDVRFIYTHPLSAYRRLQLPPDSIEILDSVKGLNFDGLSLRKTLLLAKKSDPSFFEWGQSPVMVTGQDKDAPEHLAKVAQEVLKQKGYNSLAQHYRKTSKRLYEELVTSTCGPLTAICVDTKKLFNTLHAGLSFVWVASFQCLPPLEFEILTNSVLNAHANVTKQVDQLVLKVKSGVKEVQAYQFSGILFFMESILKQNISDCTPIQSDDDKNRLDILLDEVFARYTY